MRHDTPDILLRTLLPCALVFALSTASLAQTQNGATESVGELETEIVQGGTGFSAGNVISPAPIPKPQVTNVVVETPTRVDTEIKDQPSSIFVITQEDVARWAPLSFDDLTFQEPNVDFLGGPRYLGEQLIIRGEGGSAVNVRLDGGRQNFVSGHSGQRFFVETDFLKEVEILRGGGSFLYGSGSAGVVNISTLDPIDIVKDGNALGLRIRNTYHSNSNEWANSVVGAGIGEKVQFLAGWSDRSADNITQADDIELPFSAVDRSGAIGKFIWTPNDENTVTITLNSYETDDIGGANPQQLAAGNSQNALVDRTVQYMQWSGDWEWNPIDNDLINLKTTVYYNNTKQFRDYTITDPTDNNFGRENSVDYDVFGIDISNRSEVFIGNKRHQFVYGIDFYTESQKGDESRNTFFVPGTSGTDSRRPDAEADFLGIYLIDEVEVNDRLTLFGGIRYDTYESEKTVGSFQSQSDSSFSPQIGFDLEITEKLSFFGQYSRGFTAPFLNSLYQDGSHFGLVPLVNPNDVFAAIGRVRTPVVQATADPPPPPVFQNELWFEEVFVPNPNLMPETSDNFELGVHFEDEDFAGGQFSARLTGFFKLGENTIDTEIVGSQTTPVSILGLSSIAPTPPLVNVPFPGQSTYLTGGGLILNSQFIQDFRQFVNRPETEIYGFEFSADYDADCWFAAVDIGMVRGRDTTTGQRLNTTTGDQIATTIGFRPCEAAEIGFYGIWNSGRDGLVDDQSFRTEAYDIYGIFIGLQVNENWELRAGVDNLFDQGYTRFTNDLLEPGRNLFVTSTIHF